MAERENASPRLGNIGYFSCRGDERIIVRLARRGSVPRIRTYLPSPSSRSMVTLGRRPRVKQSEKGVKGRIPQRALRWRATPRGWGVQNYSCADLLGWR